MSLYGISDAQLEQLMYPNGRGVYHYGGTPVGVNRTDIWANGVQPGGVSSIGNVPVRTGVVAEGNPTLGVAAGQAAATGMPTGAEAGGVAGSGGMGGMGGYASIATQAIQQIADVASKYVAASAQAKALKAQQAIPDIPQDESQGALSGWQPPKLPPIT